MINSMTKCNGDIYIEEIKNNTDEAGCSSDYYYDNEEMGISPMVINRTSVYDKQAFSGSHHTCASCQKNLYYNHNTTYAYSGHEFCSTYCRKKFSDEDLNSEFRNIEVGIQMQRI